MTLRSFLALRFPIERVVGLPTTRSFCVWALAHHPMVVFTLGTVDIDRHANKAGTVRMDVKWDILCGNHVTVRIDDIELNGLKEGHVL